MLKSRQSEEAAEFGAAAFVFLCVGFPFCFLGFALL